MSLCPNGQAPIVEWQYPDKEKNRILGADNYSIGQQKGQCIDVIYKVIVDYKVLDYDGGQGFGSVDGFFLGKIDKIYVGRISPPDNRLFIAVDHYFPTSPRGQIMAIFASTVYTGLEILTTSISRKDNQPDNIE